jgi:hypothetical protein
MNGFRRRIGGVNICILARCWHSSSTSNDVKVPMVLVSKSPSPKEYELTVPSRQPEQLDYRSLLSYNIVHPDHQASFGRTSVVFQDSPRCDRRYEKIDSHGYT